MAVEVIEIKDANGVNQRVYVDKIGTDNVQVVKPGFGPDDSLTLVTTTSGLPVQVVAGATGTEYTEGATDTTITGVAVLWEDAGDTLRPVSASKPMPVNLMGGSFTLTSGTDPLTVGGDSDLVSPAITISTTAYTVGDVVGGRIQVANALGTLRSGILQNVVVSWASGVTPALDILLFDSQPTQNTADNAAFAWNAADDAKVLWKVSVETADYFTVPGATARTFALKDAGAPIITSSGSSDLWMYVITRSGFTAVTTSGLRVKLGLARD